MAENVLCAAKDKEAEVDVLPAIDCDPVQQEPKYAEDISESFVEADFDLSSIFSEDEVVI